MKQTLSILSLLLAAALLAVVLAGLPVRAAPAASTTLLISEVQTGSATDADLEFIEITNASASAIPLNGYRIVYRSASGSSDILVYTFTAADAIPARGHFLLVHVGKNVGVPPDATFSTSISRPGGGLAIRAGDDTIVDSLGWGTATNIFVETTPATAAPNDQSMERRPGGDDGNGTDTDNNFNDFQVLLTPRPQNTASPPTPPSAERFLVAKSAPASVEMGQLFTYTLVATNQISMTALGVVITDALPTNVTIASISDGGVHLGGNVVRWDVPSLDNGGRVTRTVAVTAPALPTVLVNDDYRVWASNWPTPALGAPLETAVLPGGGLTSIYQIQYTTDPGGGTYPSPLAGQVVTTTGVVYAVYPGHGFCIAESAGPWHGIYVYYPSGDMPLLGDALRVRGTVQEYYGLTELANFASYEIQSRDNPIFGPDVVTAAQIQYNNGSVSEGYEGVFVELHDVTVTAGNDANGIWTFTDGSGGSGKADDWAYDANPAVGDVFVLLRGALFYDWNEYKVMPRSAADAVRQDITPPTVVATWPAAGAAGVNPYRPLWAEFSEPISPTTVSPATFLVQGPGGSVAGSVGYDPATRRATFDPAAPLAFDSPHTATLTTDITDLSGNPLAADFVWTFTTGPEDTTAPTVVARQPAPEASDVPLGADVVITFSEQLDPATVVAAHFTLQGPYGSVPWSAVDYDEAAARATLDPRGLLLPTTRYTVTIAAGVTDWAGHPLAPADRTWSFTTQAEPPMFAFLGDLHNHTSYSDGSGLPEHAFASAQACGLDFLAVTDHSYAISDAEWADILAQAEAATQDGVFVGLRGFEYTQGGEGHTNVYNTVRHATRSLVPGCAYCDYTPNLEAGVTVQGFYPWLAITGTQAVDGAGTVMQFNHPGWINFNDWAYHPEVEDVAELEEVGNGWGSSYVFSWDEWIRSLDYGWRVGATNNTDNHSTNWGCISPHRTGVVMAALTKDDLLEALRARRTYASEDSNFELFFRANGYWMGAEIPNTGHVAFQVQGNDPDGELADRVELFTDQGQVVAATYPAAASFDWQVELDITPGVHYYFAMVTQADGERIVSSPVWTSGDEDISITDLSVQPSLPTIYNPSLFTARVTNRGQSTQTVTVDFTENGSPIGQVVLTVPPCASGPCADGYAVVAWQPLVTGPVTVTAALVGAPAGDNPEDNQVEMPMTVTDERIPLILIDNGHGNIGTDPHGTRQFVDDLTLHGYNVLFNLDEITAGDLNTETVRLVVVNAYGPNQLTAAELAALGDFVAAGGSLWLNSMSDYTGKVWWANTLASRMNGLIAALETRVGEDIPIRFNDDEILDGNNNNGYPWGVLWHLYPFSLTTGVGVNVVQAQSWSDASLVDRNLQALTQDDLGANGFLFIVGDLDPGSGTYGEPNCTHNTDADGQGDAYLYGETEVLPGAAGYDIPGAAGRLFFYGDSNDPFNVFAYVAGDGKQNELLNLEIVMWLLGEPLQPLTIAEARTDPELDDSPERLDQLVWVEGVVTSSYGEFFDVLTVQDDSAGITVFAPAGTASSAISETFQRGDCVRVVGTMDVYQGDTEIQFFETEQVDVLTPTCVISAAMSIGGAYPLSLSTGDAALEENEGWLVVVTGTVTARSANRDAIWVDDGSGPVRAFLDGYNGVWSDIGPLDRVVVAGLASEDGAGPRIRVRNYGMHPQFPDDAIRLWQAPRLYLPLIARQSP